MPNDKAPPEVKNSIEIRILATTDLHGAIGAGCEAVGLTHAAKTIADLREEHPNHLLFDNGDFLQCAPICNLTSMGVLGAPDAHPIVSLMNSMAYDAVGLGNHEFDFGLEYLNRVLSGANFPAVCSNLETDQKAWSPVVLLNRTFTDSGGTAHTLKIGVFSLVPPQVMQWCRVHLEGRAQAHAFHEVAQQRVSALRRRGADLVIALCHAGDAPAPERQAATPSAHEITSVEGLDVVICGHTHQVSPKEGETRRLERTHDSPLPMVLPGNRGRFVGSIDLTLEQAGEGWRWVNAACRNIAASDTPHEATLALAAPWVDRAKTAVAQQIGSTSIDISSHFSVIHCDPATRLAAGAKLRIARPLLNALGLGNLPTIAAASPFTLEYNNRACCNAIPAGPVSLGQVYGIYPYFNAIDAFEITGAQAADWLEASASGFFQIKHGQSDQPLWNPQFPKYDFDSLLGVTYDIDLSQPALYSADRRRVSDRPVSRINNMSIGGRPLGATTRLILVTNSFRGGGGANFPHVGPENRIALPFRDVRASVQEMFAKDLTESDLPSPSWRFVQMPDTSVTFETGPNALQFLPSACENTLADLGITEQGVRKFRLSLSQ